MSRRSYVATALIGVLIGAAGCSSRGSDASATPATLPSSSGSSSSVPSPSSDVPPTSEAVPQTEEAVVADVYKAYYGAIYVLPPLPTDVEVRAAFSPYAEPQMVEVWVNVFAQSNAEDLIPAGAPVFGDVHVEISGDHAAVSECRDGSSEVILRGSTGEQVSQGRPGQLYEVEMALNRNSGAWLVHSAYSEPDAC